MAEAIRLQKQIAMGKKDAKVDVGAPTVPKQMMKKGGAVKAPAVAVVIEPAKGKKAGGCGMKKGGACK